MRKICVVITARPSYSRIKSAMQVIQASPDLELQLVLASSMLLSQYGNAAEFVRRDGFRVDVEVNNVIEGSNLISATKSTGLAIIELATVFANLKPDAVIVIADRYETVAVSIAAAYMNIPLVHVQGGEITGSIDEKVRHANTKMADVHMVSNEMASRRVIQMGENPAQVYITGCPSIDLAAAVEYGDKLDFDPYERYGGVGAGQVDPHGDYAVVMQHPVTTSYGQSRDEVNQTLEAAHQLRLPTFWFWPNVDAGSDGTSKGIRAFRENHGTALDHMHFFKNMSPEDFLKLIYHAKVMVGNSSSGIRESGFLGVPVVNIGPRQNGRDRGKNVLDVPHNTAAIAEAIQQQMSHGRYPSDPIYGRGDAGQKIAQILVDCDLPIEKRLMMD